MRTLNAFAAAVEEKSDYCDASRRNELFFTHRLKGRMNAYDQFFPRKHGIGSLDIILHPAIPLDPAMARESAANKFYGANTAPRGGIFARKAAEMASIQETVCFGFTKCQCKFRHCYGSKPPDVKSIKQWYEMFKEIGSAKNLPRSSRPNVREAIVSTKS
ncbi:hypothetical protein TNCV_1077831 [Trichonephila clavipes]|uniref:DUF4817 domain-containing protein n=1 Tax=Trichonephila clavipes TaxID=2585209 RepID=A0A8X6V755_TRICX|nr:hypothetical protein TNCV_1077831 [Trichonephila clavipes]